MEKAIKAFKKKLQMWKELAEWEKDPKWKDFFHAEACGALHLMEEMFPEYSQEFQEIFESYGFK